MVKYDALASVAQLVEQSPRKGEVVSSTLTAGSNAFIVKLDSLYENATIGFMEQELNFEDLANNIRRETDRL